MRDHHPGQVEDYTNAFLGMFYLILVMALVVIWGMWGYPVALMICACIHWGIHRLGLRLERHEARIEARIAESRKRRSQT
ncbi:MAG: hypothetical protein AAF919_18375 [Pseudomonadota bacterium]